MTEWWGPWGDGPGLDQFKDSRLWRQSENTQTENLNLPTKHTRLKTPKIDYRDNINLTGQNIPVSLSHKIQIDKNGNFQVENESFWL